MQYNFINFCAICQLRFCGCCLYFFFNIVVVVDVAALNIDERKFFCRYGIYISFSLSA